MKKLLNVAIILAQSEKIRVDNYMQLIIKYIILGLSIFIISSSGLSILVKASFMVTQRNLCTTAVATNPNIPLNEESIDDIIPQPRTQSNTDGHIHVDSFNNIYYRTSSNPLVRVSPSGVVTVIPMDKPFASFGKILSNANGDIFQIIYVATFSDPRVPREVQIYKTPYNTTEVNLVYKTPLYYLFTQPLVNSFYDVKQYPNDVSLFTFNIDKNNNLYYLQESPTNIAARTSETNIVKLSLNNSGIYARQYDDNNPYVPPDFSIYPQPYNFLRTETDDWFNSKFEISGNNHIYILDSKNGVLRNVTTGVLYNLSSLLNVNVQFPLIKIKAYNSGVYVFGISMEGAAKVIKISDNENNNVANLRNYVIENVIRNNVFDFERLNAAVTNEYIYYQYNYNLRRFRLSDSSTENVSKIYIGDISINDNNNIAVYADRAYKINCANAYAPSVIGLENIDIINSICNQQLGNLSEIESFDCTMPLLDGYSYLIPPGFKIRIEGSEQESSNCIIKNIKLLECKNINFGSIKNTSERKIQISFDGVNFLDLKTVTTWQRFSNWSSNPITLKGPTYEELYKSKMYQAAWGTDNGLYLRFLDTSKEFSNWKRLSSITIKKQPQLSIDPNGDLIVFAWGTDNGLYFWKVDEAGGEKWRRMGNITLVEEPAIQLFNDEYWIFATGTDFNSYATVFTNYDVNSYTGPVWQNLQIKSKNSPRIELSQEKSYIIQTIEGIDNIDYQRVIYKRYNPDIDPYFYEKMTLWTSSNGLVITEHGKKVYRNTLPFYSLKENLKHATLTCTYDYKCFKSLESNFIINMSLFKLKITEAGMGFDGRLYHRNMNDEINPAKNNWIQGNNITILNPPNQVIYQEDQYQFVRGTDNKLWTRKRS